LSPEVVDRMTIVQVLNAFNGYHERESERNKALKIISWETTRWMTLKLINMSGKTLKHDIKDPKQLITFDWEDKGEQMTEEQFKELADKFPDTIKDGKL
jgi:hypothetical protein